MTPPVRPAPIGADPLDDYLVKRAMAPDPLADYLAKRTAAAPKPPPMAPADATRVGAPPVDVGPGLEDQLAAKEKVRTRERDGGIYFEAICLFLYVVYRCDVCTRRCGAVSWSEKRGRASCCGTRWRSRVG